MLETPRNRAMLRSAETLAAACAEQEVLEARAVLCDSEHNLHIELPCMEGVIPYVEGAIGIEEGAVRDIALISRVGKPVSFVVESIYTDSDGRRQAILSRRRAQQLCREQYIRSLRCGDIIDARVTRLESFGAFCDIGCGLPALLPIACLSVSRIAHPRDRLSVGDHIHCAVSSLEGGRVCLSLRELLGTWEQNAALFSQGETVMGVVRSVESYGIFVELTPNLAGLAEVREGIKAGQLAGVYIKSILPEKMKIKLVVIDSQSTPVAPAPLRYFIEEGHIDSWEYAPACSGRRICSVFTQDRINNM